MPTVHNEANVGDIAKTVIMCGDPLRAKAIAEKYLTNYRLVNKIRNMYAYTGFYKDKEITVMAHGMGIPSAGIYVYELFKFYGVDKVIRVGSCGTVRSDIKILDVILVDKSYTESNYAYTLNNEHVNISESSKELTDHIEQVAEKEGMKIIRGDVLTSDCFDWYMTDLQKFMERLPKGLDLLATEMEAFVIFYLAKLFGKEAACLLTVVDSHCAQEEVSAEERQNLTEEMTRLAFESIL